MPSAIATVAPRLSLIESSAGPLRTTLAGLAARARNILPAVLLLDLLLIIGLVLRG